MVLFISNASNAQTIALGQTASLKSPVVGSLTREYNEGIKLALNRTNAAGGIKGRKVELAFSDDEFDANKTVAAVDTLVSQQNILALVGVIGTQQVLKLANEKTLQRHQLASIGPLTGLLTAQASPNQFPVRGSYDDEVRAMFRHTVQLGLPSVLFLYYEAGVGPALARLVPDMARDANVKLAGVLSYPVIAGLDLQRDAAKKVLAGLNDRPQAVVLLAIGQAHSGALKAVREKYGAGMPVYSIGQVNPALLVKDVGNEMASGLMLTQVMPAPGTTSLRLVREFDEERKRFAAGMLPTYISLEGYIAGRIAVELLQRAKTLTREGVLQAARQAGRMDIGGFRVEYGDEVRRSINPIDLTMIRAGGGLLR